MEKMFKNVGITTAEQLRKIGANKAYKMVLDNGVRPHFIGYYALVMGLQGRPWNDCQGVEKVALRKKFDEIKASTTKKGRSEIETALDRIGVRALD